MPSAPDWSEFEWRIAEAVAALQGVAAVLARGCAWHGPDRWQRFLAEQSHQTRLRRARIAELLPTVDAVLRNAGIPAVALKGAALYELGVYAAGERPMGDIDLLLSPTDMAPAAQALRSLGFTP